MGKSGGTVSLRVLLSTAHVHQKQGGLALWQTRSCVLFARRMWTPSITPRTTESLTCWTSATWRAGDGGRAVKLYYFQHIKVSPHLQLLFFPPPPHPFQGFSGDRRLNGIQHLVHETVLQRPTHWVGGDRAGPAHGQQVVKPGGDHSGERRAKIVSFHSLPRLSVLCVRSIRLQEKGPLHIRCSVHLSQGVKLLKQLYEHFLLRLK